MDSVKTSWPGSSRRFDSWFSIGIIQAATSINEMTLSFVPKVIIVILTIAIFTNYLLTGLTDYFMFIFESVASLR